MSEPRDHPTPERLMQLAWGYAPPLIVEAAVRNGVFDRLASGRKSVKELAATTGASPRGLAAVCDALVGIGLLTREGDGFALTPESAAFLVSDTPGSVAGFYRHMSSQVVPNWLRLTEAVQSGRPVHAVNREAEGASFFEEFVESLFPLGYAASQAVGRELKVHETTAPLSVLDVAAGSGVWGIALAELSPKVRVTAVDWERVLPVTRRVAARHGVAERFTFVAGDLMTAPFGHGHRIATLGHILHSEGEARSRSLLRRVFDALAPGGTVVVAEFVVDEDRRGPAVALFFAVNMLIHTDAGNAYTFAEMSRWLTDAGFRSVRRLEVPAPSPLILATKP